MCENLTVMTDFHVLIPVRLAATRLPRKPLLDLGGEPLIVRVLQRAASADARSVCVATDSKAVAEVVERAGGSVVHTRSDHACGTDRLSEAVMRLKLSDDAIVVNLQGDEPEMPAACLRQVADVLERSRQADMATLWRPLGGESEWLDENVVKVVVDRDGRALYFSRSPIPALRGSGWPESDARGHIGLYAYRVGALRAWSLLPDSRLEQLESLEQLRALEAGWTIACQRARTAVPAGIDTPEDLEKARRRFVLNGNTEE